MRRSKNRWRKIMALLLCLALALPAQAILPDEEPEPPKPKAKPKAKPKPKPKPQVQQKAQTCMVDDQGVEWCRDAVAEAPKTERQQAGGSFRDCADCPEMVRIPGGSFMMGSSSAEQDGQADERPRHAVRAAGFALGKYEVTRAQFGAFVDDTGYSAGNSCWTYEEGKYQESSGRNWQNPAFSQGLEHPAVCVSVADAEAYARWLSQKTGKRYRLPTEAEWEYAARGGTDTARYWGDDSDSACRYANVGDQTAKAQFLDWTVHNCSDGYVYTAPVGSFRANAFGLYDMLGNVGEFTCSAYTESGYDGSEESCNNDATSPRVFRGGAWYDLPANVRAAVRFRFDASDRYNYLGFRLAQD